MRKCLLLLIVAVSPALTAKGDGKFFVREKVPAGIPYQRAILLFHEKQETLILQSKYDLPESAAAGSLGWVVPVPAVPEIAGGDADMAKSCFLMASMRTQPHLHQISHLFPVACSTAFVGGFAFMVVCLLRYPLARRAESSRAAWGRQARNATLVTVIAFLLTAISIPPLALSRGSAGVDVIKAEKAGVYDVKVIRGQSAEAMVEWLRENHFIFGDEDRQVLQDYVNRTWCFVTAKVDPNAAADGRKIVSEGLTAPLILRFAGERPIYPLALTAAAGTETEILIYTLSDVKLACGERLTLRHARQTEAPTILRSLLLQAEMEEWPVLRDVPETPMVLCKFKGRLPPAQMKEDLEFTPAPDNEPYRERRVVW